MFRGGVWKEERGRGRQEGEGERPGGVGEGRQRRRGQEGKGGGIEGVVGEGWGEMVSAGAATKKVVGSTVMGVMVRSAGTMWKGAMPVPVHGRSGSDLMETDEEERRKAH